MSKRSINEWDASDASDASDDEDGLKTPKTPGSHVSKPEAEGLKYSMGSPSYCPTDPYYEGETDEDRAHDERIAKARRVEEIKQENKKKEERKTPAAIAKRDAEHAKLLPLFDEAGLKLPKADATNWWSHNHSLGDQIERDQQEFYRMEAKLRLKKNAHGAAESFYYSHHA